MRSIALSLALAGLASPAAAQCFDMAFGTPLGAPGGLFGDVMFPIQPIGFAFPIGGTSYTDIHVCDKGYVFLSNGGTPAPAFPDFTVTTGEFASESPRIAALWADIQVLSSNNGQVYIKSTPTTCTITWENARCYNQSSGIFNMQMELSISGQVKFLYGPGTTNNSDPMQPTWQVGLAGISPGLGATLPAASDLSAGGATIDPLVFEEWIVANTFDMANNGLLLIPNSPTGYAFVPLGAPVNCASVSLYGNGCVEVADSFYEEWTTGFDLNNTTVTWLRGAAGYVVTTAIPGTFVTPGAGAINVAPAALDGEQAFTMSSAMPSPGGPVTGINVTTKGQIELASTISGGVDYTPTVDELLNGARTVFCLWHDYSQISAGSGLILYEEVGPTTYVTWNGVHSYSSATPSTFQFQLDRPSGNVTLVILTMGGFANPDVGILGYSVAGPSPDPGATDLSALVGALSIVDTGAVTALELENDNYPTVGNANFSLSVENVPNLAPVGIMFFGSQQVPGLDLTFIGMPSCFAYTNADLGSTTFPVALPQGVGTQVIPIPNNPALVNVQFSAQAIAFTLLTPLNLASSNGAWMTIGN